MSRRTSRESAIQALYQLDFHEGEIERILKERGRELSEADSTYYQVLVRGVLEHKDHLDQVIEKYLKESWSLYRLASVDRAIIRMAAYELVHEADTPPGVAINEAVELAKTFSSFESAKYINGVLGSLIAQLPEDRKEKNE